MPTLNIKENVACQRFRLLAAQSRALRLFRQPSDDVALLDRLHGSRTEFGKELIDPQPES
jgi:hypothetical protein